MANFDHVLEPTLEEIWEKDYALKGKWAEEFFQNTNPIVLELGCGKGEYTVALAKQFPEVNFLGIDIKGARIWYGAQEAIDGKIDNAKFLRTRIDFIDKFFDEDEIAEIWITFPDPQPEGSRERKRLTGDLFLDRYRKFLVSGGRINLKHDSDSFYQFTLGQIKKHELKLIHRFDDVYKDKDELPDHLQVVSKVQTHYEKIFSEKGHVIKFLSFEL